MLGKPKLQWVPSRSRRVKITWVIGIWKCLLGCQDRSPAMFLFANCSHCILWQTIFGKAFTMTSGNFAKHIFVKCPPKKIDNKNGIWQVLKTSILNTRDDHLVTRLQNGNSYMDYGIGGPFTCRNDATKWHSHYYTKYDIKCDLIFGFTCCYTFLLLKYFFPK